MSLISGLEIGNCSGTIRRSRRQFESLLFLEGFLPQLLILFFRLHVELRVDFPHPDAAIFDPERFSEFHDLLTFAITDTAG